MTTHRSRIDTPMGDRTPYPAAMDIAVIDDKIVGARGDAVDRQV